MRFFSKLVFICNLCFIAAVILRFAEQAARNKENFDAAIPFQPLQSTLVLLGYGAIFLNIIFVIATIIRFARGKIQTIPRWLLLINLVLLPVQIWYFFFSNF